MGQALAGPLAGVLLADMGADVIKIEQPEGGDDARIWVLRSAVDGCHPLYFEGQEPQQALGRVRPPRRRPTSRSLTAQCGTADILIRNLRPAWSARSASAPGDSLKRHPRLIYCSIWAFGYRGPLRLKRLRSAAAGHGGSDERDWPEDPPPTFCGASISDKATGIFCTIGGFRSPPSARLHRQGLPGRHPRCLIGGCTVEGRSMLTPGRRRRLKRHGTGGAAIVRHRCSTPPDHPLCPGTRHDRLWARCARLGHS